MVQQPKLISDTSTPEFPRGRYFIRVLLKSKDARGQAFIKIGARMGMGGGEFVNGLRRGIVLESEVTMKKLLLIIAAVGALAFAAQPAQAGVHVGIGIGVGGPAYYGGYYGGYYPGYYGPGYYPGGYPYYGYYPAYGVYVGPGYYPWYHGHWGGGYYRGGSHGGYYHHR
jgi:hypothetical protein